MIKIDKRFENNINKIKELSALLEKNENEVTRVPILVFNSLTGEKPKIDISSIILPSTWENCKQAAYFGDLVGEFKTHEQKKEFFYIVLEIIHGKDNHEMIKDFKKIDEFSQEIYILADFFRRNDFLKLDNIKIYKFDSPDFIIELSNGEIILIEITCANPKFSLWFSKDMLKVERVFKKQKQNNQPLGYPPDDWDEDHESEEISDEASLGYPPDDWDEDQSNELSYYYGITEDNIYTIRKHFKKQKKYYQNVQKFYSDKPIKILYCIPLGDASRLTVNEEERLKKIKNNAIEFCIDFKNVFVLIAHNKDLKWWTLEEIVTDLNL